MQQVAPMNGEQAQYVAQAASPVNPITAALGPRFALVPKIYPYAEACGSPPVPQSISMVAVGDIQSPMHLKQVVNQVNSAALPPPFTSHIPQSTCLCFYQAVNGVFSPQQVMDVGGSPVFSMDRITKCDPFYPGCCRPVFSVMDKNKQEIGHLDYVAPSCGILCAKVLCLMCCRTATLPEWAWLSAVDPHERERLTFRHPAQEGQCLLCMCQARTVVYGHCCSTVPDMPFHKKYDIYGPMPEPGVLGNIEVRGAYGWDQECLCQYFGVRPEVMTTVTLQQNLSFEDTTLAIQMALDRTQEQFRWYTRQGYVRNLPFLKPGQVVMA